MTRPQYIAMCIIGGIALLAYLQSYQIAKAMRASGIMPQPGELTA